MSIAIFMISYNSGLQETGLHLELTIEEELHFFGRLHDLDSSVINERIEFFVNLLQLPKPLSVIGNLR